MENVRVINSAVAVVTELPQKPVLSELQSIARQLVLAHFRGKVVLDLLVSKGLNGRFIEVNFDGQQIDRASLRVLSNSEVPESVVAKQTRFFQEHRNMLRNSILSKNEINQLFH